MTVAFEHVNNITVQLNLGTLSFSVTKKTNEPNLLSFLFIATHTSALSKIAKLGNLLLY